MTLKIEILVQNFVHFGRFEGSCFPILGVKKVVFLDFFKVVLELFRKCLGIVFDLKKGQIFSSKS